MFKDKIDLAEAEKINAEREMRRVSDLLMEATELNSEDVYKNKVEWKLPSYVIYSRNFCQTDGWCILMVARPAETEDPGWSNREFTNNDKAFYYVPQGTATRFYPYEETLKKILKEVYDFQTSKGK